MTSQDIAVVTQGLTDILSNMRSYHRITVDLLNSEVDEARPLLDQRQLLIDDINAIYERIREALIAVCSTNDIRQLGDALRKLAQNPHHDSRLDGVVALVKQLQNVFADTTVIEKRLIADIEKKRADMINELKDVSQRKRVADTPYFTQKTRAVGGVYDRKK